MVCASLAIVGKNDDEPIYLRDFTSRTQAGFEEKLFGFFSVGGCSVQHHFLLQSALQTFNELVKDKQRADMDPLWLGLFYLVDNYKFYGCMTTTGLKIIAAIDDKLLHDQKELQQSKDSAVKFLLSNIHSLYVGYLLNPFNNKMGFIDSWRFDRRIDSVLDVFNNPRQSELDRLDPSYKFRKMKGNKLIETYN